MLRNQKEAITNMRIFRKILILVFTLGAISLAIGACIRFIERDWDGFVQYMIACFVTGNAIDLEKIKIFLGIKE